MVDAAGFTSGWTSEPRFLTTESYHSRTNSIARRAYNAPAIVLHCCIFFAVGLVRGQDNPLRTRRSKSKPCWPGSKLLEKGVAELKATKVASAAPAAREDVTVGRNNKLETIRICSTVVCVRGTRIDAKLLF